MLPSYEKLGLFYLGRRYDLDRGERLPDPVLYESRDLVTHAVCVGMTGSGKTGLGISVIEEAALDGIPVLAIDPKGDLANLLLTFPNLQPSDFAPWVDAAEAQAHGSSADAAAARVAELWRAGLADWDQDGSRIARLCAAADVQVYTPGSRAGVPLALLASLHTPAAGSEEGDAAIASTAAALLALAGVADLQPHSREQALVAAILASAPAGATLPWLVQQVQRPSLDRIGVMDLETFYPARDRQELALRFNSVLAAPGFDVWTSGHPLDIGALLYSPAGRPRIAIVSIAHLDEARRMLVVSLLLNAVLDWTRQQSGTRALRALVYMDEVFGYLPPVANPPSKLPLLTLLKQARAYGVGLMLATQNPVDLDYKALSNTGTWFLGKLQTERDKARVLDGLEGLTAAMDRAGFDRVLSRLRSRVFLLHNVHAREPMVFETRWTLSYLRGPMGREDLRRATGLAGLPGTDGLPGRDGTPRTDGLREAGLPGHPGDSGNPGHPAKPLVPPGVPEYYLPADGAAASYEPVLYGAARVHYVDAKRGVDIVEDVQALVPFAAGAVPVDWHAASETDTPPDALASSPPSGAASYTAPPAAALDPKRYAQWTRDFERWLTRARPLRAFAAPAFKLTSRAGESEHDFMLRVQHAAREGRDAAVEKLRAKYATRAARLTAKVERAREAVAREEQQVSQQKTQTAVSVGATILGALLGRKAVSASTLGRATTAARGVSRSMKEAEDVERARTRLADAEEEMKALEAQVEAEAAAVGIAGGGQPRIETIEIKPKRGAVDVRLVALAWQARRV